MNYASLSFGWSLVGVEKPAVGAYSPVIQLYIYMPSIIFNIKLPHVITYRSYFGSTSLICFKLFLWFTRKWSGNANSVQLFQFTAKLTNCKLAPVSVLGIWRYINPLSVAQHGFEVLSRIQATRFLAPNLLHRTECSMSFCMISQNTLK